MPGEIRQAALTQLHGLLGRGYVVRVLWNKDPIYRHLFLERGGLDDFPKTRLVLDEMMAAGWPDAVFADPARWLAFEPPPCR